MVKPEETKKLAALARLEFTAEEFVALERDLNQILGYVEELNRVDLGKVEPASNDYLAKNVLRADGPPVIGQLGVAGNYFKVKKIL